MLAYLSACHLLRSSPFCPLPRGGHAQLPVTLSPFSAPESLLYPFPPCPGLTPAHMCLEQVPVLHPPVLSRYQWWRDGIANTFKGSPPRHPVLLALRAVMDLQQQGMPQEDTLS